MVTIIADNYYGYCKKEVKTQISFAANLYGLCEEEHAGGAHRVRHLRAGPGVLRGPHGQLEEGRVRRGDAICWATWSKCKPEGYAVDRRYPNIFYVPEDAEFNVREGFVTLAARRTEVAR